MPKRSCENCEYFDSHFGDCLNRLSPRFQTKPEDTCAAWFPDTGRWPIKEKTHADEG